MDRLAWRPFRRWGRTSWPLLKTRSMSTEVAGETAKLLSCALSGNTYRTWNYQIVQSHAWELREHRAVIVPPLNLFWRSAEVEIQLVSFNTGFLASEFGQVVEYISRHLRARHKNAFGSRQNTYCTNCTNPAGGCTRYFITQGSTATATAVTRYEMTLPARLGVKHGVYSEKTHCYQLARAKQWQKLHEKYQKFIWGAECWY